MQGVYLKNREGGDIMKRLKVICIALVTMLVSLFAMTSCMVIQAQKMKNVVGTYHLKHYSVTNGKTNKVTDYLEKYGYDVYMVVTGESKGYYIHSDNDTPAYSREITLRYIRHEEDTEKVAHVEYSYDGYTYESLGVTHHAMNYSRPRIYISDLLNTDGYDENWERVDDATDLSYVRTKFPQLREYNSESYAMEGIYEMRSPSWEVQGENQASAPENPYYYYYVALDPIAMTATVAYLEKAEGSVAVKNTGVPVTLIEGWNAFKIGDVEWRSDQNWTSYYYSVSEVEGATDGSMIRWQISATGYRDIFGSDLDQMIANATPQAPTPAPDETPDETPEVGSETPEQGEQPVE